ncbi:Z1 domain-containing protein [Thermosporothrix hazakensis]|uniref:Z1 domain-containing protein n=1 Tax=Thermosporothrix hazakensis TaxID=644383 RepID=A0A326U2J7_THEHA|nr:Z1 domain-containing protein [Thermosporothrix hazakensis]PZW22868.1 Z1 domain-containing protein [Thermosporothrix hazakensis]
MGGVETVEIIMHSQNQQACWSPVIGSETLSLLDHLKFSERDRETVKREAVAVLAQCVPPTVPSGQETSLVIGYIQSGKTTSFTTVAALARDNGYHLIIVITGITRNLFEQSSNRLERDLRIRERTDRKWQFLSNPKSRSDVKQRIAAALQRNDTSPHGNKTVLITVMKNATHLNNLIKLLSELSLDGMPTLVIDDEADQASLNNLVNKGKESATYRRIVKMRQLLPHHTFLQYTATPQAPLLINLIDVLSPNSATMLTPGPTYTGGKIFFERDFYLIRCIPAHEIPKKDQSFVEPPESLLQAMRIFYLGVADGLRHGGKGNRSMMIHPSKETMQHANYEEWVRRTQQYWSKTLLLSAIDPDRQDLINDFKQAYTDLYHTVENLPSFNILLPYLVKGINDTIITKVNAASGPTPLPDWHQDYSHILIGGEVLNRGYTVEGLTVTYMPRSKGVGNADTIQQRARWFGYKSEYIGYCRVYLTNEQIRIYKQYIVHEENVREQLAKHLTSGKSLRDWKRAFFLSPELRPTRHDVLDLEYIRGNYSNDWCEQHAPHDSFAAIQINRKVVQQFLAQLALQPDRGHQKRTEQQKHLVAFDVSLGLVYRELLTRFLITRPSDSQRFIGLLLQIGSYLDQHGDGTCAVYLMSGGKLRKRTLNNNDEIPTLFQGPNPDKTGIYYPGDRNIRAPRGITVQIHNLKVQKDGDTEGMTIIEEVPTLAVWLPKEMSANWIVQTNTRASKRFARSSWE